MSARIAITTASISAGRPEVAKFCAGTSVVAYAPKPHVTGRAPVDDLSWWKPFLQLRGPGRIAGPDEARRLFSRTDGAAAAEKQMCIDHSEDDVPRPTLNAASAAVFSSMRNRHTIVMPDYHDDRSPPARTQNDVPEAYVIAERVTAPVELRFFPQRQARAPRIVDC